MRAQKSIMEKGNSWRNEVSSGLTMCRISKVYPEKRMCEVKTFGESGAIQDNSFTCQWLSSDANPEGDESSTIPRINSIGVVAFVDGEPFIIGFLRPLNDQGTAAIETAETEQEVLNEGDKVIKTVGKNKVILRASGEIQIESTRTCRTIYFPNRHLINELCRNYEFRTDGGTEDWIQYDGNRLAKNTVRRIEERDTISRTNIVYKESGTVDKDNLPLIYRRRIGKGVNGGIGSVVHTTEIKNTGETHVFIRAAEQTEGYDLNILPSGDTTLKIGGSRHVTNIKPTGETNMNINGKMNMNVKPSGETVIDVGPGKSVITIKPDGNIEVTTTAKIKMKSPKIDLNDPKSGITTENSHFGVVDMITGLPVLPSKTVFSDV